MLQVDPQDREKLIDPLLRTGWRFWLIVGGLSLVIGWGLVVYIRQLRYGLGQTDMHRPVYWGMYMVNFIFFIGISHAGTLISAILRVTGAEWRRPITRVAEAITAFALIIGTLQIILDMGRPDRLYFTLLFGRLQSPILWDVVAVTIYFSCSIFYLYLPIIPDAAILRDNLPEHSPAWRHTLYRILALGWRGNITQWKRLERAISIMAIVIIPVAVSVHTIISWILATTVQPGWHSAVLGPYFVVGAIFSGIGALFLIMTAMRHAFDLKNYIKLTQYRYLGLLLIVMTVIWAYFTYAESMTLAASQQLMEFPVLASKLWGRFAPGFWAMMVLMGITFWTAAIPHFVPSAAARFSLLRPRHALLSTVSAGFLILLLADPQVDLTSTPGLRAVVWTLLAFFILNAGLGLALWLKQHLVTATVVAGAAALVGMWLERWNIIVPTMTHPRLVLYSTYTPTVTEISLTAASFALFILLIVLFFKLFPPVSIWEIAEGRVLEADYASVVFTVPEANPPPQKRRWRFK